ncbi:hypothetical protein JKF63_07769 [Porcisia hertigi]|uniref:Uncharacterized protein n=1 Tax=Porcisia hertigi TaxID=2761500 RepID=A0A836LLS3_9TRYP|nr:hypothetical protein JKF63_07769 [Porcisia hertigi]
MPKLTVKADNYLTRNEVSTTVLPFAKERLPPPPTFVCVLAAVGLLLYQLLDNLDGHQARRTGTSSPLGLLMDHGCDAINCIIGGLSIAAAVSAGPCWKTWLIVLNTVIVFFLNTWEEYYRGVLVLPVINGPNEGILIAIAVYLWTAWIGGPQWWYNNAIEVPSRWLPQVLRQPAPQAALDVEAIVLRTVCPYFTWQEDQGGSAMLPLLLNINCSTAYLAHPPPPTRIPLAFNPLTQRHEEMVIGHSVLQKSVLRLYDSSQAVLRVRYNTIAVFLMTIGSALTSAGNIYQVYRAIRSTPKEELQKHGGGHFPFLHALSRLVPLVVMTLMANVWFLTSQEDVFRRHPRIFCWTVGLLYTKLAVHLMLAHLCSMEFFPFRRTFAPFLLFGVHLSLTYLHKVSQVRRRQQQEYRGQTDGSGAGATRHGTFAYDLDEEILLYEFFLLSLVTFIHLVWNVLRETAAVLEAPIFTVPLEKQKALRSIMAASLQHRQTERPVSQSSKLRKSQ